VIQCSSESYQKRAREKREERRERKRGNDRAIDFIDKKERRCEMKGKKRGDAAFGGGGLEHRECTLEIKITRMNERAKEREREREREGVERTGLSPLAAWRVGNLSLLIPGIAVMEVHQGTVTGIGDVDSRNGDWQSMLDVNREFLPVMTEARARSRCIVRSRG